MTKGRGVIVKVQVCNADLRHSLWQAPDQVQDDGKEALLKAGNRWG
jgi:hypothetical protein